jgi:hypothetical protein
VNLISILDVEFIERGAESILVGCFSNFQAQHGALFMSFQPLHFYMAERRGGQEASR